MAAVAYIPAERFNRQHMLRTGHQTGLFAFLSDGPATLSELVQLLGWSPDRCQQWLGQLETAGFVEHYDEFYWGKVSRA